MYLESSYNMYTFVCCVPQVSTQRVVQGSVWRRETTGQTTARVRATQSVHGTAPSSLYLHVFL